LRHDAGFGHDSGDGELIAADQRPRREFRSSLAPQVGHGHGREEGIEYVIAHPGVREGIAATQMQVWQAASAPACDQVRQDRLLDTGEFASRKSAGERDDDAARTAADVEEMERTIGGQQCRERIHRGAVRQEKGHPRAGRIAEDEGEQHEGREVPPRREPQAMQEHEGRGENELEEDPPPGAAQGRGDPCRRERLQGEERPQPGHDAEMRGDEGKQPAQQLGQRRGKERRALSAKFRSYIFVQ